MRHDLSTQIEYCEPFTGHGTADSLGFLTFTHSSLDINLSCWVFCVRCARYPFLGVWLVGWTLGGATALLAFLWQLGGSETIEVAGETLRVWRSVLGLHLPARIYATEQVRDLRVPVWDAPHHFCRKRFTFLLGLGPGAIAFD